MSRSGAARVAVRDVSPFLQALRNFLLGRKHTKALRFSQDLATRSPPLPELPDGPAHKLSANYYYSRDARREVAPPEIVATGAKQVTAGESTVKRVTPGNVFLWD